MYEAYHLVTSIVVSRNCNKILCYVHEIETKLNMKRTGYHGHAQRLVSTEP